MHALVGQRTFHRFFLAEPRGDPQPPAHLSVHLHYQLDLFVACQIMIEHGPRRVEDTGVVTEAFPALLGEVRREWREHDGERFQQLRRDVRFTCVSSAALPTNYVHVLHERGDRCVVVQIL